MLHGEPAEEKARGTEKYNKMKHKITIRDTDDLDRAAAEFIRETGKDRIIAFHAPMGAGKTTFTTAICKVLGVEDTVCSPTFTILNEYITRDGEPVYHFDFYRIRELREAVDIGLDDYLYSGHICIIEWPENVEPLLPAETLSVRITVNPDLSRTVEWDD